MARKCDDIKGFGFSYKGVWIDEDFIKSVAFCDLVECGGLDCKDCTTIIERVLKTIADVE